MPDPILKEMLAEQAYGPLTSAAYADAGKAAHANEVAHSISMDPTLVDAAFPDALAEERTRKRIEEARRNATYARIMANTRFAMAAFNDDAVPKVAQKIGQHVDDTSHFLDFSKVYGPPGVGALQARVLTGAAVLAGRFVSGLAQLGQGIIGLGTAAGENTPVGQVGGLPFQITAPLLAFKYGGRQAGKALGTVSTATHYETSSRNFNDIASGVESLPGSIAALGVTALTGSPLAGVTTLGAVTGGQSYLTGRDEGLNPRDAALYGLGDAVVESGTELLPEKYLGRMFGFVPGGSSMIREGATALGVEVVGEQVATALQGFNRWYWIDSRKGQTFNDFLKTLPDQERSTLVATLTTFGLTVGAGHIMQRAFQPQIDARLANNVDKIMEAAAGSQTRTANPTDFAMALDQVLQDTPAEHIYIPAEKVADLFKAEEGGPPASIADDPFWSQHQQQVAEAVALGGDVVLPLNEVATHLAGTPQWEAIKDFVRVSPKGMSLSEAKQGVSDEQLEKMAGDMAAVVHEALPRMQQAQALTAVKNFASGLGYAGEKADLVSRYIANALYTAYHGDQARRVEAGEEPVTIAEFAKGWLPKVERQTQAQYDAAATAAGISYEDQHGQEAGQKGTRRQQAAARSVRQSGGLRGGAELLAAEPRQELGFDQPLPGSPESLTVPGRGKVAVAPHVPAREAASRYMRKAGRTYRPALRYAKLDEARARRLATAFEEMKHDPKDPLVLSAYQAMIDETLAQFQEIKATGLTIEFIEEGQEDPYAASPRLAIIDVQENNHLWVFPTTGGFGQGEVADSPMLQGTSEFIGGRALLANDVFRIVHDYFGHIKDGHGFRAEGEENAWQSHAAMYSPLARRAMTTETRGQNSWLNFGPHGEANRTASTPETIFAPQKVGLMPEWASEEGMLADPESGSETTYGQDARSRPQFSEPYDLDLYGTGEELTRPPTDAEGNVTLEHFSQEDGLTETDPTQWGRGRAFYTPQERVYMRDAPPRTYFGIATNQPGGYRLEFTGRTPYRAKVPLDRLYDAVRNPDDLWIKGRHAESEHAIRDAGHAGYWVKHPELGLVAVVFEPVEVSEITPIGQTFNQSLDPPGFERAAPFLTEEEKASMRASSKAKLLEIVDTLPKAEEMAAVAYAGRAKKGWYARSAQAIVDVFGIEDAPRFAALLAALSPQVPVEVNFYNAVKIWTAWNNEGRPTDRQTIVRIMGENVTGKRGEASVLGAWVPNTFAALSDPNPATLKLSGPKVNSFMANLVGVVDEVTNDTWMARYAGLEALSMGGRRDKTVLYKAMNAVTREAARIASEKTGEQWEPMEIQETVWSFAKTLYEAADRDPDAPEVAELLDAGGLTHADIASTVDFGVLFTDGVFKRILEEGGYGQQVADLERAGRNVQQYGAEGEVTSAEGSGFAADDFRSFLRGAASRIGRSLDQRRAGRQRQLSLTFNQSVTPAQEVFFSNAQRAVQNAKQEKASAQQWIALLTPGRTPGIKAEEIEWTGVLDWLKMQQGQIEKGALLQFLQDRGVLVDEVVLGRPIEERLADYGYDIADMNDFEHEANLIANEGDTQFEAYSSDPSNETYRELLLTLPTGQAANPEEGPPTHWQTENVVAHVRFMDKTDAEGKRVLFIEEVQSDWHQKGRDLGYQSEVDADELRQRNERVAKAITRLDRAEIAVIEKAPEVLDKWREVALPEGAQLNELGQERKAVYEHLLRRIEGWRRMVEKGDDVPLINTTQTQLAVDISRFMHNTAFNPLMRDELGELNNARLEHREAYTASDAKGIPDAPFKSSWPALVMKRMIRWAVDNGYEKIAWTTGEEQAERYNLSQATGPLSVTLRSDGGYLVSPTTVGVAATLVNNDMAAPNPGDKDESGNTIPGVLMTVEQLKQAFGNEITQRIVGSGEKAGAGAMFHLHDEQLRVGGEGMKAFYDRNLANITNDIIKKYGAKVGKVDVASGKQQAMQNEIERLRGLIENGPGEDTAMGQGFMRQLAHAEEAMAILDRQAVHPGFEITPQLAEAASGGFPLFQNRRGNITIQTGENGLMQSAIIRAFEAANFSTAVHELGHFFLADLQRRALTSGATDQERADWQTFKDWSASLGHEIGDDGVIPVEAHEYFARGMERFVWEGVAPSRGLRAIFTRMREFMLELYRTATAFNAPITPEIREVMSRMLASQEEIDAQRKELGAVSDAVKGLMSEQERQAYDDLSNETRQNALDKLYERVLSTLRQKAKADVRERTNMIRFEVENEVDQQPIMRALKLLRIGIPSDEGTQRAKLDRQWLIDTYGEDVIDRLPKTVPPIVSDRDTMDADHVAMQTGFANGDELVSALLAYEQNRQQAASQGDKRSPRQRAIDEQVDQRVAEEIGDPYAHLEEEAQDAIATDRQADLMSMEVRALARKTGQKPTPWKMAKEWAHNRIAISSAKDAISGRAIQQYARAVAKAAKEAEEFLIKGDFEEAFRAKQRQLLNMALMSEAKAAANDVDAAVRQMQKIAKSGAIPSVDPDYLDQAHALLEDVDLKERTGKEVERRASFAKWHEQQVQLGILPVVPEGYREALGRTHWSKMTVADLKELDDAVKQIVELGRLKRKLMDGRAERDFEDGVAEMLDRAEQAPERMKGRELDEKRTLPSRARSILRSADAAMLKMEQITRWLDGDDPNGPWTRLIFRVMGTAQGRQDDLTRQYATEINDLIKALPKPLIKKWGDLVDTPELVIRNANHLLVGEAPQLRKDQVVMMAMNWGNEGNRQRLLDGFGWEEADVLKVFDRLMTKEDWDFAQSVWITVDKLWPEVAALERRVNGLAPEKVEALPIITKYGVYSGGYFPVVYDTSQSTRAAIDEENRLAPEGGFQMVTTRSGATKQRAEAVKGRPLLLSMGVITRHMGEVIHDITHREAVMQVKKLLSDQRIATAIRKRMGPEYYRAMTGWLENVARPGVAYSKEMPALVALGRYLNKAVTMVGLGFRVSTSMMQLLGLPLVASQVGERHLIAAAGTIVAHPVRAWNEMQARSAEMRARADTLDATIEDMVHEASSGKLQTIGPKGIQKYAMRGIAYMDMVVSTTAWTAGFNKGLAEGMSEEEASLYGDSVVRITQGAGGMKDRSAILNAHPMARSLWSFFSYLNALYNMQRDVFRRVRHAESAADIAEAARRGWWVMIVPMILQAAIFGQGPDDEDEDGDIDASDWARYLTAQVAIGNLGSLPLIGTLASALGNGYTYRSSAYNAIGEGLMRGLQDAHDLVTGEDELKGSTVKSTITTVGLITAKPLGQIGATAGGLYDYATGEADPQTSGDWYNLVTKGYIPEKHGAR